MSNWKEIEETIKSLTQSLSGLPKNLKTKALGLFEQHLLCDSIKKKIKKEIDSDHEGNILAKDSNVRRSLRKRYTKPKIYDDDTERTIKVKKINHKGKLITNENLEVATLSVDNNPLLGHDETMPDNKKKAGRPRNKDRDYNLKKRNFFECNTCHKLLSTKHSFSEHQRIHTGESLICDICGQKFLTQSGFTLHLRFHSDDPNVFKCSKCKYVVKTQKLLDEHFRDKHDPDRPKNHICHMCGKAFHTIAQLENHSFSHSSEKDFHCELCDFVTAYPGGLKVHYNNVHATERVTYKCELCGMQLRFKGTYQDHLKRHFNRREKECTMCGKTFLNSSQLAAHKRTHLAANVPCLICNKKLKSKHKLVVHMLMHSGQKDFTCPDCTYSTYVKHNLKKHCWRIHNKIYPPVLKNKMKRYQLEDVKKIGNIKDPLAKILMEEISDLNNQQTQFDKKDLSDGLIVVKPEKSSIELNLEVEKGEIDKSIIQKKCNSKILMKENQIISKIIDKNFEGNKINSLNVEDHDRGNDFINLNSETLKNNFYEFIQNEELICQSDIDVRDILSMEITEIVKTEENKQINEEIIFNNNNNHKLSYPNDNESKNSYDLTLKETVVEIVNLKSKNKEINKSRRKLDSEKTRLPNKKCAICNKMFYYLSQLSTHMLSHKKPMVPCSICGKKLKNPQNLSTHMLLHTGKKDFNCPNCKFSTYVRQHLRRHCLKSHEIFYPPSIPRNKYKKCNINGNQSIKSDIIENDNFKIENQQTIHYHTSQRENSNSNLEYKQNTTFSNSNEKYKIAPEILDISSIIFTQQFGQDHNYNNLSLNGISNKNNTVYSSSYSLPDNNFPPNILTNPASFQNTDPNNLKPRISLNNSDSYSICSKTYSKPENSSNFNFIETLNNEKSFNQLNSLNPTFEQNLSKSLKTNSTMKLAAYNQIGPITISSPAEFVGLKFQLGRFHL